MNFLLLFVGLGICAATGVLVATIALYRPAVPDSGIAAWNTSEQALAGQLTGPLERVGRAINERAERRGREPIGEILAAADLRLRAGEFFMIQLALLAGFAVLGLLRYGLGPQFVTAGVAGYLLPMRYVRYRQRRRLRMFNSQLPDTLTLLANALKAGHSLPQAIETVSRSTSAPISHEFARIVREMNIGRSAEQALRSTLKRVPSDDFELIVTAVSIHAQVGGNLARVLDGVSHTIRERIRVKGHIQTLTAQARLSGWIITLIPLALALFLYVITPSYFRGMLSEPIGWGLLGSAAISILAGNAIIRRIVAIKV